MALRNMAHPEETAKRSSRRTHRADPALSTVRLKGLKCASPVLIAHVSERELRDAIREVDGPDIEAIIQVGTNLAMARLAGIAEFWLDKPVLPRPIGGRCAATA